MRSENHQNRQERRILRDLNSRGLLENRILGPFDHPHSTLTELRKNAIVGAGFADHDSDNLYFSINRWNPGSFLSGFHVESLSRSAAEIQLGTESRYSS